MPKIIATVNQKGGIGKTTTSINIASAFEHMGLKTLLIDMDPQCNASSSYDADIENEYTLYNVMCDGLDPNQAIQHKEMGDIIAGSPGLAGCESRFQSEVGGFNIIKKAIAKIEEDYDFVIIDTPPSLGIYMINALTAATGCVIPLKADSYSIEGLGKMITTVNDIIDNTNPNLVIYGALLTTYDARCSLDNEVLEGLPLQGEKFGFSVFSNSIRICQPVKEAQSKKVSLFDYNPKCNAAIDYANLAVELYEKTKK